MLAKSRQGGGPGRQERGREVYRFEAFQRMLDRARTTRGVAVMGICNVTPDSFSDGGRYLAVDAARARVDEMVAEGADIVDIGGESTRPGAVEVPADEQLRRVLDVVRHAAACGVCVSIDTANAKVAAASLDAGACAVNDASCLRDIALGESVAAAHAAMVLMHTRGFPAQMRGFSLYPVRDYGRVVADVCEEWEAAAARARSVGVKREAIVMDPGLGFAKNARQSIELLARIADVVRAVGAPVAIGASRKSFLTVVDANAPPSDRLGASLAAAVHAARGGASVVRVHDVRATRQALDLTKVLAGP